MASIAVRVRVPGLADQSIGVRVRMLRRGPDLQDTAPSPSPQNLLPTFLLSVWNTSTSDIGNGSVANAAMTSLASLRSPHEWPTISRLYRSTIRQT